MDAMVQAAKIERKTAEVAALRDIAVELINNPIIDLLIAVYALESLERSKIIGNVSATLLETGVVSILTAKVLGPALPALTQSTVSGLTAVGKLAPLLLAK